MNTKIYLDELVSKYETKDFIKDDPIQFPHRYNDLYDVEIAAFLASVFAYGKREVFISKLNILFDKMDNKPFEFVKKFDISNHILDDFSYRFSVGVDLIQIILILKNLYLSGESLGSLFEYGWNVNKSVKGMLQTVVDYFYSRVELSITKGFYHLLPDPSKNSACKRLNMFLRWMVRDGFVDLGKWTFINKSELLIPMDVHVARVSRKLKILTRSQNDYKAVLELTKNLKQFDSYDPVKYDFAMFGFGVNS